MTPARPRARSTSTARRLRSAAGHVARRHRGEAAQALAASPALGDHRAGPAVGGGRGRVRRDAGNGAEARGARRGRRRRPTPPLRRWASSAGRSTARTGSTTQRPLGRSSVRIPRPAPSSRKAAPSRWSCSRGPTPVAIPDLTGMSDGQAGEALKNSGLVVVTPVTEQYDENVPEHFVISWDPTGTEIPKGSLGQPRGLQGPGAAAGAADQWHLRRRQGRACGRAAQGEARAGLQRRRPRGPGRRRPSRRRATALRVARRWS